VYNIIWPPPPGPGPVSGDDAPWLALLEAVIRQAHKDAARGTGDARRFLEDLEGHARRRVSARTAAA